MSLGRRAGAALRWPLAGAVVIAAHAGLAGWLMQNQRFGVPDAAPQPIEVAFEPAPAPPEAQPAETPEEPPLPEAELEPEPRPEPEHEPEPEPEPEEAVTAPPPDFTPPPLTELPPIGNIADLIPAPPMSELALAQSERPLARPIRREPEPQPQREPQQRRADPAPQPQPEPQRQATNPAPAQAAPQLARPAAPSAGQIASWQQQVGQRIARHMMRTRIGRSGSATVQIAITISGNGATAARLNGSTGDAQVDRALASQAARMPSMPAPPGGQAQSFVLPVAIQFR